MDCEKLRVLVIDDEKDMVDLIQLTLSPSYDVLTHTDPAKALDIMDFFEPDLVILDIMMPKVTGYQILETMKQRPKLQNILVLLLSAKSSNLDMKYGYKLGANLYLPKPFDPERLHKNVQMLLDQPPVMGKPRRKTYSLRDVTLRMQLLVSNQLASLPGAEEDPNVQPFRLKRPLGQEAEEQEGKKWVG